MIQFAQAQRLAPILKEVKDCLGQAADSGIELARSACEPVCSLWGAGLSMARAWLESLVNEEHSLLCVGAQLPLKTILGHLYRAGLHVAIGVSSNCSLVFTIGANPGD